MDRHSSCPTPRSEHVSGSYDNNRDRNSKRNTYNKHPRNDGRKLHALVLYILPFISVDLVIFTPATSTSKVGHDASDTKDYRSVGVSIRICPFLPTSEMSVTTESQPLEMGKGKEVHKATLANNGALQTYVKGWNGTSARLSDAIQVLDDMMPTIQEDYVMEDGILIIMTEDSQLDINFDATCVTDGDEKTVKPSHISKGSGEITSPTDTQTFVVSAEDYAGNIIKSFCVNLKDGLDPNNRDTGSPSDGTNGTNGSGSKDVGTDKGTSKAKESTRAKESTKTKRSTKAKEPAKAEGSSKVKESAKAKESTKARETTKTTKPSEARESTAATTATPLADPRSLSLTQASQAPSPTQTLQTPSPTQTPQSPLPTQASQTPSSDNDSGDSVTIVPLG